MWDSRAAGFSCALGDLATSIPSPRTSALPSWALSPGLETMLKEGQVVTNTWIGPYLNYEL